MSPRSDDEPPGAPDLLDEQRTIWDRRPGNRAPYFIYLVMELLMLGLTHKVRKYLGITFSCANTAMECLLALSFLSIKLLIRQKVRFLKHGQHKRF